MVVLRSLIALIPLLPLLYNLVNTQQDRVSPCPKLFKYGPKNVAPDNDYWSYFGTITLLRKVDSYSPRVLVTLDQPPLLLGLPSSRWYVTQPKPNNSREYLISISNYSLKANEPHKIQLFVKYNPSQPPSRLVKFSLDGEILCSDETIVESTSPLIELQTNSVLEGFTPAPSGSRGVENINIRPGGIINLGSAFQHSEDFFSTANKPQQDVDDKEVNEKCGTVAVVGTASVPLIINGEDTSEGEYPWHAALYQTKGVNLDYLCGASLITKSHIVTAAHCVTKWKTPIPRNTATLVIYLGRYDLHHFNEGMQERLVADIIPHHQYNPQRLHNDIAVVKFTMPIQITNHVRPVCLWQDSNELGTVIDKQGSVVGWGMDETGKVSEKLKQAKMPVVSQETCLRSLPEFFPLFTSNRTFCAGFRNGTSVCNGDSGDGMVFPTANSTLNKVIWQLRGIVSLSVDLKMTFKCDSNHYIVFTDAAKHLDWIKQVLQQ